MDKVIRIGTRDSQLALWQANAVKSKLEALGYKTELVPVKSTGDLVLDKPLYEMGITGIFTKTLDIAMLNGTVDIAVHSMKDVPTALPKGIIQSAVLERAATQDVLVANKPIDYSKPCIIATGSLRRKAQWLHKYPHQTVIDLRGNVQTRLKKLKDNNWDGAIFAKAGLERLRYLTNYLSEEKIESISFSGVGKDLDWMLPAPAQGAMVIVTLKNDDFCTQAISKLNHKPSEVCTEIERDFLKTLEGGCTAPIGALAEFIENKIRFRGCLFSLGGSKKLDIGTNFDFTSFKNKGTIAANELLENGGQELMEKIKKEMV
jgi:hydroxymethylbilane synthase